MMRLPEFKRLLPSSVAEAAKMLNKHTGEAKLIAGGTALSGLNEAAGNHAEVYCGLNNHA